MTFDKANDMRCLNSPPLAVGGMGGSGTRLISHLLQQLGFHMGSDLNPQGDNLWFSFLFRHRSVLSENTQGLKHIYQIFRKAMLGGSSFSIEELSTIEGLCSRNRFQFDENWLQTRKQNMLDEVGNKKAESKIHWGWKEPNTHIVIDSLFRIVNGMKYIHVYRHGLDMAFSANQNQQILWADALFGLAGKESPERSLKYWCKMHQRVFKIGAQYPNQFYALRYDDFCSNPEVELFKLNQFLGLQPNGQMIEKLQTLINPSSNIGRYKLHDTTQFDKDDLSYVRGLGFVVD